MQGFHPRILEEIIGLKEIKVLITGSCDLRRIPLCINYPKRTSHYQFLKYFHFR